MPDTPEHKSGLGDRLITLLIPDVIALGIIGGLTLTSDDPHHHVSGFDAAPYGMKVASIALLSPFALIIVGMLCYLIYSYIYWLITGKAII